MLSYSVSRFWKSYCSSVVFGLISVEADVGAFERIIAIFEQKEGFVEVNVNALRARINRIHLSISFWNLPIDVS